MLNLEALLFLGSFLIFLIFLVKERKNLKLRFGVIVERRWKGEIKWVVRISCKYKKLWEILSNFSLISAFVGMILVVYLLVGGVIKKRGEFGVILPAVKGVEYPSPFIPLPIAYWIISIFSLILIHELFHAIYARTFGVKTKSYGIFFLLFLPIAAFVEPNKSKFKKLEVRKKLKIFAAGSFGNFLFAFLVFSSFFLFSKFLFFFYEEGGVLFLEKIKNSPAEKIGLEGIIIKLNNQTIRNLADFAIFMNKTKPNQTLLIQTTEGKFKVKLAKHPKFTMGFIGVGKLYTAYKNRFNQKFMSKEFRVFLAQFEELMGWLFFIHLGVGLANLLPLPPLDGGLMVKTLLEKKKFGKVLTKLIFSLVFSLLLLNLLFSIFKP